MAGQLASLPLSLQLDSNARPLSGGLLYLYNAGTSTPNVFYEDFATTVTLSWPLVCDVAGRIPMFWVVDGSYRVRFTDSAGNEIFDINSITAVGPSSGVVSGGSSVGTDQIFQTGDILWQPIDTSRSGWVRGNARTIGSSSSGASERASADCQNLFLWFWTNFSDSLCPVSGGRGATALADWSANKRIGTVDMRGRTAFGLDTMGNTAAGVNTGATSAGVALGAQSLSIAQANLPAVSFSAASLTATPSLTGAASSLTATPSLSAASHTHGAGTFAVGTGVNLSTSTNICVSSGGSGASGWTAGGSGGSITLTAALANGALGGTSAASGALAVSGSIAMGGSVPVSGSIAMGGSVPSGGSGTAVSKLSPGRAGSWFFKL